MRKIKILHFELSNNSGGIESFLYNLYSCVDREKYQFDFITRYDRAARAADFERLGGHIFKVSPYTNPIKYCRNIQTVLKNGYDIVHIHKNSAANLLPFIIANHRKHAVIISHSHSSASAAGRIGLLLHRINQGYLWKMSKYHLACSNAAGQWMYGNRGVYDVIKNGIVTKSFIFNRGKREQIRNLFSISDDALVVGHVGTFNKVKNHAQLLSIFEEIFKINSNSYLMLVGSGPLEKEIHMKVDNHHIKNVLFLGRRDDVSSLVQAMDIFLMPSLFEGFGIAAIEAEAAGVPVFLADTIPADVGVTDSVFWFSNRDECMEVAKRICSIQTPTEEQRIIRNQQVVSAGFDIKNTSRKLCELYESCCICK